MDDMTWNPGERVTWTRDSHTYNGVVEVQRRGWVLVTLDEPRESPHGWTEHRMMVRNSDIQQMST